MPLPLPTPKPKDPGFKKPATPATPSKGQAPKDPGFQKPVKPDAPKPATPAKPSQGQGPKAAPKPAPINTPIPAPSGYKAAPGETFFSGDGRPPGGSKSTWVGSTIRDGYFKNQGSLNKADAWSQKQPGYGQVTVPWSAVGGGKTHLAPSGENAGVAGNITRPSGIPNFNTAPSNMNGHKATPVPNRATAYRGGQPSK